MSQDFLRHDQTEQLRLRLAAIDWLRARSLDGELPLSREDILDFRFEGEPFRLQDLTKGIRRPAGFSAALTVTTSFKPKKQFEIYDDHLGADGLWHYSWEKGGPSVPTNIGLLAAYERRLPLIGFLGLGGKPALFRVVAPIQVVEWLPEREQVVLAPGSLGQTLAEDREHKLDAELVFRRYLLRETKIRVHQPYFRSLILRAYENRCAICSLGHAELLDAAHIIPDSENGEPVVTNGLALCKIHHAAFDSRLIGVDGDYKVHVRRSLLDEVDGPMLLHGLQEMHGHSLRALPSRKGERPSRDALDVTFARFLAQT